MSVLECSGPVSSITYNTDKQALHITGCDFVFESLGSSTEPLDL
jgi:hypothetical protein